MTTDLAAHIAAACDLKRQINDYINGIYKMMNESKDIQQEARETMTVARAQYTPALQRIIAASTVNELLDRSDGLDQSLNKGWAYCSAHPTREDAREQWEARLLEYEVIQDALKHRRGVAGVMERISQIEGLAAPLEQRSLL